MTQLSSCIASCVAAGIAASLLVTDFNRSLIASLLSPPAWSEPASEKAAIVMPATRVNRDGKGDRLSSETIEPGRQRVATVEVGSNATIIYRGTDGRVLFRNDPGRNATWIAKNVDLVGITVHETPAAAPAMLPAQLAPTRPLPQLPTSPKLPIGCDAMASEMTRSAPADMAARCVAEVSGPAQRSHDRRVALNQVF